MTTRWQPIATCPKDPDDEYLLRTAKADYVGYWHEPVHEAGERVGYWVIFSGTLYSSVREWAAIDDVVGAARTVLKDAHEVTQGREFGHGDHEAALRGAIALLTRLLRE